WLAGGRRALPLFRERRRPYPGQFTQAAPNSAGPAARIPASGTLAAAPSRLGVSQPSPQTSAGDPTRPNFLYDQLTGAAMTYSPTSGIGTTAAPFSGTIPGYIRQMISQQGQAADAADSLKQGQDIVLNTLQQRFNNSSSVNIAEEMANLLNLQNSYSANARVLSAVKDMVDTLLQVL